MYVSHANRALYIEIEMKLRDREIEREII